MGRERELQTIIDAAEDSADPRAARLVAVIGEAGVGQVPAAVGVLQVRRTASRSSSAGTRDGVWPTAKGWPTGRWPRWSARVRGSWRRRTRRSSRAKLRATVEEFITDERERRLVEPRLAHLLGSGAAHRDRPRRPVQRLAAVLRADRRHRARGAGVRGPAVGRQRAARLHRLSARMVSRPSDLHPRPRPARAAPRPAGVAGRRSHWSARRPGDDRAARRPGPGPARQAGSSDPRPRRGRAAVRGGDGADAARPWPAGPGGQPLRAHRRGGDLEVPETLQALVAARLDDLDGAERSLVQDAAVIGQSFTPGRPGRRVGRAPSPRSSRLLDGLVDKQVLAYIDDVRSAERGQYSSCRGCCAPSRWARCRAGTARPSTWPWPGTSSRPGARRPGISPRSWPATISTRWRPTRRPRMPARSATRPA